MKIFASCYISDALEKASGVEVLSLSPYVALDEPVNTHADMLVFVLENKIFCYDSYYEQNKPVFELARSEGYEIVRVSKKCSKKYPNDIALNVLRIGKSLYSCVKNTASEILEYAKALGYDIIDVRQGYSACSTLVLDENNAITADKSIHNALAKAQKNVLLIEEGNISLTGYEYGFIGGASCVIEDKIFFFGDITKHPNYEAIHEKIISIGKREIIISCGDVFDFGGARVIF